MFGLPQQRAWADPTHTHTHPVAVWCDVFFPLYLAAVWSSHLLSSTPSDWQQECVCKQRYPASFLLRSEPTRSHCFFHCFPCRLFSYTHMRTSHRWFSRCRKCLFSNHTHSLTHIISFFISPLIYKCAVVWNTCGLFITEISLSRFDLCSVFSALAHGSEDEGVKTKRITKPV